MSFLRLRRLPLEPDSGEEITSDTDQTSASTQNHHSPSPPTMVEIKPLINRSKSADPPGTSSFILTNSYRKTTYDTEVDEDEDDDGSSSVEVNTESFQVKQPPVAAVAAMNINRIDPPPLMKRSTTTHPTITSPPLPSSSFVQSQPLDKHQREIPTEVIQKRQTDVPLPKMFDKDRNLVSNAPLHGPTRSPEVTLVSDTAISSVSFTTVREDDGKFAYPRDQLHESVEPGSPSVALPEIERIADELSLAIQKSVQFADVHVHEHIILDTSCDSEDCQSFAASQSLDNHDGTVTSKSYRRHNDPPPTVTHTISTVDEYEARREPQRRHLKEQEKKSGKINSFGNRSDQLRHILSTGTPSRTTTSFLNDGTTGSLSAESNASTYVSVQELHSKGNNNRIGASPDIESTQEPPLSQNANDIFEAYQQSFVEVDQGEKPAASTRQQQQQQKLPLRRLLPEATMDGRRSKSLVSFSRPSNNSDTRSHQQQGRGLFRRFFPKKDSNLMIEL